MNTSLKTSLGRRRGVLLLVVLSTLIVFLLLGTLLLTQSTRSRTAARAFAKVSASSASNGALARELLNEALMQLVRGDASDDPAQATDNTNPTNDSILLDKFHGSPPVYAEATSIAPWPNASNQPFLQVIITAPTSGSVSSPLELNGRILTFLPEASQAGMTSSYRILRAKIFETDPSSDTNGNGLFEPFEIFLANQSYEPGATPPTNKCRIVINSPEFRVEGHDSFADDFWLTEVREIDQGKPMVLRPAFEPTAVDSDGDGIHDTLEVDNDGDGELDGTWRSPRILSTRTLSDGTQYEFDVSYLVQDLDSRVNLNAHSTNPVSDTDWALPSIFDGTASDFENIPTGGGWGVADVRAASVFQQEPASSALDVVRIQKVRDGGTSGKPSSSGVRHPYVGFVGGVGATSSTTASQYEQLLYGDIYTVDLKSLAKMYVATDNLNTSSLRYAFTNSPDITYAPSFPDFSFAADPYELRLDSKAPRQNRRNSSIFSLTELERVLRLYDGDATALPQRLAAVLGSDLENVRSVATTDSWDTPALTGGVAATLEAYFTGLPNIVDPYDLLSPDLASGRRFDVNRPVSTPAQKQLYCRDLFVLLVALGASADADLAQWVVNVMDYRDPDSTITRFEWDDDLANGWDPSQNNSGNEPDAAQPANRNPVYGTEMPELILGQTLAWYDKNDGSGGLHVLVMRPPPEYLDVPGLQEPIEITRVEDALAVLDQNGNPDTTLLDLGRRVDPTDPASSPIWRLAYYKVTDTNDEYSVDPSTVKYVRFDTLQSDLSSDSSQTYNSGNTSAPHVNTTSNPSDAMHVAAGGYLCISPTGSSPVSSVTVPQVFAEHGAPIRFEGLAGVNAANDERFRVALERLQDPEAEFSETSNPYVAIGSMPVRLQNDTGGGNSPSYKSYRRETPEFWKTPSDQIVGNNPTITSLDSTSRDIFNWPNRPFISQVELALVPQGSGRKVFDNIRIPAGGDYFYLTDNGFLAAGIVQQLMAATYVPSRHVGTSLTFDSSLLSLAQREDVGLARAGAGDVYPAGAPQITTWREPGRMNINTMAMEPSLNALSNYGNQRVWRAMFGSGSVGVGSGYIVDNDDTQTPFGRDVKEVHELLSLAGGNELYRDAGAQASLHPVLAYRTAIKLGNVATIRSNVFAVWITLRVRNTQTDEKTYHRLFAIVDRSIPVAFAPGQDLNAANTIRLKRYIN